MALRVGHDWATLLSLFTFMHWRRKWQPTQCSCLENPRDGEPGGLPSLGSHRIGHDWSNLAATAAFCWASQVELMVENLPANSGDRGDTSLIPGQETPLEEAMATHSRILAWRIPWTEEPGSLCSMGSQRVRHDWSDSAQAQHSGETSVPPCFCSHCFITLHSFLSVYTIWNLVQAFLYLIINSIFFLYILTYFLKCNFF